jgi:hypothetical protein
VFLESWNAHDAGAAAAIMTEQCVFEPSVGRHPWGDRLIGRVAVREWAETTFAQIPNIRWKPLRSFVHDEFAVFEFHVTGTPKSSAPIDIWACDVLTLRGNQIAAKRAYRKAPPSINQSPR